MLYAVIGLVVLAALLYYFIAYLPKQRELREKFLSSVNSSLDNGATLLVDGKYEEALHEFDGVLAQAPLKREAEAFARAGNGKVACLMQMMGVDDKEALCQQAITVLKEAVGMPKLKQNPMEYAKANANLGDVYRRLAVVSDGKANYGNAINAYREALKIYTASDHPDLHRQINSSLQEAKLG